MTKTIVVVVAAMSLSACNRRAEATASSTNPNYKVEQLFTYKGCTTYRFEDYYTHYYTVCDGSATVRNETRVSCGKNCTRPMESTTNIVDGGCQ